MLALLLTLFTLPTESGYQFNEGKVATSIRFQNYHNLIIIPARLNDSITLKLILDTGTTSLILFGPKVKKLGNISRDRKVLVNGLGYLKPTEGRFSYPNKISIGDIVGNGVGAAVLTENELMNVMPDVDGIIGYELFIRFCIQIDYPASTITFFEDVPDNAYEDFRTIDLRVANQRPEIISTITTTKKKKVQLRTLIDTGSSLGLVVFSSQRNEFRGWGDDKEIGTGLAGSVAGSSLDIHSYQMGDLDLFLRNSKLVSVGMKNNTPSTSSSLGGAFLKDFVVMFHYPTSKFFIKL